MHATENGAHAIPNAILDDSDDLLLLGETLSDIKEHLALLLTAMRKHAAAMPTGDYRDDLARNMFDSSRLLLVAKVVEGHIYLWVIEPGTEPWQDTMLSGSLQRDLVSRRSFRPFLELAHKDYAWDKIDELLGLAERSQRGRNLTELERTGPMPSGLTDLESRYRLRGAPLVAPPFSVFFT